MKEKFFPFFVKLFSYVSLILGLFYVVFAFAFELPDTFKQVDGVFAKVFVFIEGYAHTVSLYLIIALFGLLNIVCARAARGAEKFKKGCLYAVLILCLTGVIGILVNTYTDTLNVSINNMYFGSISVFFGYARRIEFAIYLISFLSGAFFTYRTVKNVKSDKSFILFVAAVALCHIPSAVFSGYYGALLPAQFALNAVLLVSRPVVAYGALFAEKEA